MNQRKLFLLPLFILLVHPCFADKYPRNYSIDIIHYAFELKLSDSTDEISGKASILILFKSNDVKQIRLDLINKTDKRSGRGMVVESVSYNNQVLEFTHQNDVLLIKLKEPPQKNEQYTLVIQYNGIPADGLRIGPTKYGDRSFFSDNWPNKARHWLPTVDHPYDKATSEFIVTAPAKYKVISNGLLLEESLLDKAYKLTHWKQSVPVSCWLFVLGVAEFAVQSTEDFEGKSIQTWVLPKDREAGFYDFAQPTKRVLEFFSGYIGPYIFEKLANIQSSSVSGGMEASSSIFYAENLVNGKADTRLRNVVIHEIAHQWFGNAVTESTWDDAWLSEGFATYFTLLFQEYEYGQDEYTDGLKKARKSVIDYFKKDSTFSIVDDRTAETGPITNILTYQKGAWVLHMLRERIGQENFRKGIRAYYKKYLYGNATTNDLIEEMEKASGQNLKPFFDQWLNRPDLLKISGSWTYDDVNKQTVINIYQNQSSGFLFDFPLEVQVYEEGSKSPQNLTFRVNTKTAEFRIPGSQKPTILLFDPRTVLLADFDIKSN
jgi:aminopeptidase N